MDIDAVAEALADAVQSAVTGLVAYPFMPDALPGDAFCVADCEVDPHVTMRGRDHVDLTCYVLASRQDPRSGQRRVRDYIRRGGSVSVRDAIMTDKTLSGAVNSLTIMRASGPRLVTFGQPEVEYYGGEIVVRCLGKVVT